MYDILFYISNLLIISFVHSLQNSYSVSALDLALFSFGWWRVVQGTFGSPVDSISEYSTFGSTVDGVS